MVGQEQLRKIIGSQIERNEYPRFSIIAGQEGSGKRTLTMSISYALGCQRVFIEPKVDAVREMIKLVYTVQTPTMYVILDGNISNSAREALLKVCEETPKNAYICMLVSDINTVTDTLKSRAGVYHMQPYTPRELLEYASENKHRDIVTDLCEVPGDVEKLKFIGIQEFYDFVQKVVDNIAEVSPANALKMAENIDVKDNNAEKYDMTLFLRAFKSICGKRLSKLVVEKGSQVDREHYSAGIRIASTTLAQMKITGINKSALLDIFILNIRKEWGD